MRPLTAEELRELPPLDPAEVDHALASGRLDRLREEDAYFGTQLAPAFERTLRAR